MTLGEKIYEKRKEAGFTQESLAEKLGVSPQAVSKWENDASCPDIALLPKLAKLFETSVDELLSEEGETFVRVEPPKTRKLIEDMVLRINVVDGKDKVKINVPLVLLRAMISKNPESVNINFGKGKFDVDWQMLISLIESGAVGKLLELDGSDGETVFIEVV
ncbi:MAG: helix-turn-helix transcriptional regulator [Clostridia bacterium]|nr:helix-turn-helix transcriptional regulator [Clostridia bacterium]